MFVAINAKSTSMNYVNRRFSQNALILHGVYFAQYSIKRLLGVLVSCDFLAWSTIDHCVKYIGVITQTIPKAALRFFHSENNLPEYIAPISNVYWSAFHIYRIIQVHFNIISEVQAKHFAFWLTLIQPC